MSAPAQSPPAPPDGAEPTHRRTQGGSAQPLKLAIGGVGLVVSVWLVCNIFLAFAYHPEWFLHSKILIGVLSLIAGIGGAVLIFRFINLVIEGMPPRLSEGLIPYAFLLPAMTLLGVMLVYPTVQTVVYSFANSDSTDWVGLENYRTVLGTNEFWQSLLNNFLWILIVPLITVAIGLTVAVLADKLSATGEKVAKSFVFLPMSISFVGASTIWMLVYQYQDASGAQTGLLNAVLVAFGGDPQPWMQIDTARLNSLLMMIILIWLQAGFAMVLISSAIKGVPEDTVEAGRMDGAGEITIFWRIVFPQVMPTLLAVFITVLILVLKVFDIIYVMTNGRNNTNVIANLFFDRLFVGQQAGQASAIVVVLLILVTPILIYQVRAFRKQEANR